MQGAGQRIAIVSPHFYPVTCGVGDYSMRLARELVARGVAVALFSHSPTAPHPDDPTLPVYGADGDSPMRIVDGMRGAIRKFNPTDIVVQYTPHMLLSSRFGSPAIPLLLAEMEGQVRRTVVLHELYGPWSWRPDLAVADMLKRVQLCATIAASDRLFVTTVSRKQRMERWLSRSGRALEVELLFVGANAEPAPRIRGPESRPRRLGIFSMMGRTRRFDLMIEAFATVAARYPDSELVLIGDLASNQALFRQLQSQIAASAMAHRIRLTGALPLPRVAEEVGALDVYLMPDETGASTRSGTLPIALGSGVPVVATRGPETDQTFFVDGTSIVFADEMSAAALARAALQVLDDPVLAETVGAGGRALYERHLSWPSIAERFLAPSPTRIKQSHE